VNTRVKELKELLEPHKAYTQILDITAQK